MKRRSMSMRESRTVYAKGSDRIHRLNLSVLQRGGFRL